MNKIILSGGVRELDKYTSDAQIEVSSPSILNIINQGAIHNLDIKIKENMSLTLNMFDYASDTEYNIKIESESNSKCVINACFIAEGKYELNIDNNLYGDDIETSVNIRGINEDGGAVKILMNGMVAGETHNNILNEYAKIINKSDKSTVLIPNLIVNTNEVIANHGVSVGGLNEEEIFYLMSKGISKSSAKKLIEEGFMLFIVDGETREQIKNILIGR